MTQVLYYHEVARRKSYSNMITATMYFGTNLRHIIQELEATKTLGRFSVQIHFNSA